MTDHTLGPWIADGTQVRKVGEEKDYKSFKNNYLLAEMKGPAWEEKKKANAQLIAAAPELLKYLREIEEWEAELLMSHECWQTNDGLPKLNQKLYDKWIELQDRRNELIKKAKGEDNNEKQEVAKLYKSEKKEEYFYWSDDLQEVCSAEIPYKPSIKSIKDLKEEKEYLRESNEELKRRIKILEETVEKYKIKVNSMREELYNLLEAAEKVCKYFNDRKPFTKIDVYTKLENAIKKAKGEC